MKPVHPLAEPVLRWGLVVLALGLLVGFLGGCAHARPTEVLEVEAQDAGCEAFCSCSRLLMTVEERWLLCEPKTLVREP